MNRRHFLAAATIGCGALFIPGVAEARTLAISDVSVSPAQPPTNSTGFGVQRGVLSFRVVGNPPLTAANAWRGIESWGNGNGSGQYQCVDLIKRYAQKLEFPGFELPRRFNELPSLGNGVDAAERFAGRSDSGFRYVRTSGAALPRLGAVISVRGWPGVAEGHTGIVQRVSSSASAATVTLFDQNFPSAQWKTLEFTRAGNLWSGVLVNVSSSSGTTRNPVVGWADPTG
ncbi:MAG: CHAP domain-containing protein [Terricaulis sp.]